MGDPPARSTAAPDPRFRDDHGSSPPQPHDDRGIGPRSPIPVPGRLPGTREPFDVDPVLDRDRQTVQRVGDAAPDERPIQEGGVRQRTGILERDDGIRLGMHPLQRLQVRRHDLRHRHIAEANGGQQTNRGSPAPRALIRHIIAASARDRHT